MRAVPGVHGSSYCFLPLTALRLVRKDGMGGSMFDELETEVTSRREVLKKLGAGAAIVWTAPVLTSLAAPAFAASTPPCTSDACSDPDPGQDTCDGFPEHRCYCTATMERRHLCACFDQGGCEGYQLCTSSSECPQGRFCTTGPNCCGGICVRPCGPDCGSGSKGASRPRPPLR